jgi:hypothetical protein
VLRELLTGKDFIMLQSVSWSTFFGVLFFSYAIYYALILLFFYRQKVWSFIRRREPLLITLLIAAFLRLSNSLQAQDGKQGIAQANDMIRGYFTESVSLMYAIAALFALIGAIRVFKAFNEGHNDEAKRYAAAWFGGVLFVLVVATVIRSFFGI